MGRVNYIFSTNEINKLLKNAVLIIDNREKSANSTIDYLKSKKIAYEFGTLKTGDYAMRINPIPELGIHFPIDLPARIEKKANCDELAMNLQKTEEKRFIAELERSTKHSFTLVVCDENFYENLINQRYRSKYSPKALMGRLNALQARYGFSIVPISEKLFGHYTYWKLYYEAKVYLENMPVQIYKEDITYIEEKENPTAI